MSAHSNIAKFACRLISATTGDSVHPVSVSSVCGGCINDAICLTTNNARFFVKSNSAEHAETMFKAESAGLQLLATGPLSVPNFVAEGVSPEGTAVLVLQWIESSRPVSDFSEQLGRGLATLHAERRNDSYGLGHDNFIGLSRQPNGWSDNWIEFWKSQRLGYQMDLALQNGLLDESFRDRCNRVLARLNGLLMEPDQGALLHGDLWSGNYMTASTGEPVLIDPAVYYGHPEAEFGIITLFGGFDQRFYDAYHEVLPRVNGFSDRVEIYKLYHLLNHLNLFGSSYLDSCLQIVNRFS